MQERFNLVNKIKSLVGLSIESKAIDEALVEHPIDAQTAKEIDLKFGHLSELPKPLTSTNQLHSH